MKKFWKKNTLGFANTYALVYTETTNEEQQALSEGYDRITRKEAESLCRAERDRREHDEAFSGFADSVVLPIWYPVNDHDWRNDWHMEQHGYIVEKI